MGIFFSGKELIEIALGIEKNGVIFYESLADSTKSTEAREAYRYLADKEREHIKVFQNMRDVMGDYKPPETLTEQYSLYLKALVDSLVFTDDETVRDMARKVDNDAEAIQIAIGAEKDSILFYLEIRNLVRRSERKVVSKIIEEEKSHLKQLSHIKKSLGA